MMDRLMIKCKGCSKTFTHFPRKLFHSEECRKRFAEEERLARMHKIWDRATELEQSATTQFLSPEQQVAQTFQALSTAGNHYYRLGAVRPEGTAEVRWFPSAGVGKPEYLSVKPFERPRGNPMPGLYLISLYDEHKKPVGEPKWKLRIVSFDITVVWSSGTRRL
jgi:hypothetical protein